MADPQRFIDTTQYAQLKKDIDSGDRIGFYWNFNQYYKNRFSKLTDQRNQWFASVNR